MKRLTVPLVLPLGIVAAATGLLWFIDRRGFPFGHCRKCGYDLTGNVAGRCPECGMPIEREGKLG